MEMNGLMGGFYKLSVLIMRFSLTNVLWVLFNFPIVYILLILLVGDISNLQMGLLTIAILAPFIFFPATAAMYGVVRKWVMGDGDIPIFKSFLRYYKENYKRSFLIGVVFTLFWTSWVLNYLMFFQQQSVFFNVMFMVITAFFFTWNAYFFSYTVHFEMKFFTSLKSSFILAIGSPFSTIGVALINGALIFISFNFTFLIPFFVGSLSAYFSFLYFYKVIQKAMKAQEVNEKVTSSPGLEG
ncbi:MULTISPECIES: YesL family protein [Metabacillus]|jgi:uncharacterized membrane protein YesL|uniref:DUF624 domain-containing protein n=3 Tax=Metabacillus TaxID=2675233 RepID=A0A179SRZ5_9BACI|nr:MULTISPECIES: DUF624 domain-containing protein [Metabacillus]OAS83052.1 hypothetical protein A6K24_10520 [Metabacillus litoralis]QNF27606.1 DUF624 domain-containing protein [Metabacillus sp. KUDC1714]